MFGCVVAVCWFVVRVRGDLQIPELHKVKLKCSRYRPGVAQRMGRGIALLFHYRGTIKGWVVSSTLRPHFTPGKDPIPILQEAGWAPGPVWTSGKFRLHQYSIPDRPARSQSLFRLSYSAHIPQLCMTLLVSTLGAGGIFLNFKKRYTAVKRLIMTSYISLWHSIIPGLKYDLMVPRPYAIVSCDFVVMYSCTLVGMMDHLLRTFISILGADGAGSYNQGGYLDALAYVWFHNTNALHYFNQMCVCMTLWKIRLYFLFYSLPCFLLSMEQVSIFPQKGLIKWSSLCHAFYWSKWPNAVLYTNHRAFSLAGTRYAIRMQ